MQPCWFTWDSGEELHSVSVTVERQLSVSHGAVRHKRPSCHFVTAVITVDSDYTSWFVTCCLGYLVGC